MRSKKIGHLFYVTSSLVHHFKTTSEFELELDPENAWFGSKLAICLSRETLKFAGLPWKTIEHLFSTMSGFVHHFKAICEFKLELQSRQAQFRLKKMVLLLSHVTSKFDGWHWKTIEDLFYTTSWKRPIWLKIDYFQFRVTFKDLHQSCDGHQSKGGIIRHRDIKVMFDNMASNSGLKVLTKNHNFRIRSVLCDVAVHPRACLPVL